MAQSLHRMQFMILSILAKKKSLVSCKHVISKDSFKLSPFSQGICGHLLPVIWVSRGRNASWPLFRKFWYRMEYLDKGTLEACFHDRSEQPSVEKEGPGSAGGELPTGSLLW